MNYPPNVYDHCRACGFFFYTDMPKTHLSGCVVAKCQCAWGDRDGPGHTRSCPANPAYDVTPVYDEPTT